MDGWGSLTMLIKRQEADKFRKAELRSKLKNQKEGYLNAHESKDEFNFPEISSVEMKKLKEKIRRDIRNEWIRSLVFLLLVLSIIIACIIYIYYL
jgi:hypothetical protein